MCKMCKVIYGAMFERTCGGNDPEVYLRTGQFCPRRSFIAELLGKQLEVVSWLLEKMLLPLAPFWAVMLFFRAINRFFEDERLRSADV